MKQDTEIVAKINEDYKLNAYSRYLDALNARDALMKQMELSKTVAEAKHFGAGLVFASLVCGILEGALNESR